FSGLKKQESQLTEKLMRFHQLRHPQHVVQVKVIRNRGRDDDDKKASGASFSSIVLQRCLSAVTRHLHTDRQHECSTLCPYCNASDERKIFDRRRKLKKRDVAAFTQR